jgi:hypothetical protein
MTEQSMTLIVDKEKFINHVKRICRSNIRKPCKICLVCPFREYVLQIMREKDWKLPKGGKS